MDKMIAEASKVQIMHLDGSNYKHWKYRIEIVCRAISGAKEILEGKKCQPTEVGQMADVIAKANYEKEMREFLSVDSAVLTLMTTNMSDEILNQVMRYNNAKDVWDELERLYNVSSEDKSYDLCLKFFNYVKDPQHDIRKYISELKNIWHDLNNQLENKLPEILLICKILGTLPKDYFTFKSSWLLMTKKDRTIENLTAQLNVFEKTLSSKHEVEHIEEVLVVKTEKKKKIFKCNYCGEFGHRVRKCKKWISDGRPPKQTERVNVNMTVLAIDEGLPYDKLNWYVDNGATSHVTNRGDFFESFEHFKGLHTVTSANGQTIEAIGKGNIRAEANVNNKIEHVLLKDVWYVPHIKRNLFSVLSVHDNSRNSKFESEPTRCELKIDGKVKVVGTRDINAGLFKLKLKCVMPQNHEINQLLTNPLQLYHERLVHQNKRYVKQYIEREFGLEVKNTRSDICDGCVYGKAHKQKFGTRIRATQPGELIHTDICGPFPYSFSKHRYFIIFKDDFTRYRCIYFLRQKSEAHAKLKHFLAEAKVAGIVVKELLSDNGGEFVSNDFRNILEEHGIKQRLTMPHTHEQAGCVERENRTVVEAARAIMHAHNQMPEALWAEIVNASVYVLNRTGPSNIPDKSPYELWYKKKPAVKHLRILGCTCYAHVPKANRKKLMKKAKKGIFIGYEGDDGYRIWDSEAFKLIRSRDVIFEETLLLDKSNKNALDPDPNLVSKRRLHVNYPNFNINDQSHYFANNYRQDVSPECRIQETINQPSISGIQNNTQDSYPIDVERENIAPNHCKEELNESYDLTVSPEDVERDEVDESAQSLDEIEREGQRTLRNRQTLRAPSRFKDYAMMIEGNDSLDPANFKEAMSSKDCEKWQKAIDNEIASLKENQTWELVELPKGRKAIPGKWIFKTKTNPDGSVDKYKARLVIRGFSQKKDIDFHETFSPVARSSTIRTVLGVAAKEKLKLAQFDVSTAFLYGTLDEDIYMKPPEGFSDSKLVFKLNKSLYGLKQAPRCWNRCITDYIVQIGFKQSESDPCLFVRKRVKEKIILALYVDDGLVASSSQKETVNFIDEMRKRFKITVKPPSFFLGMEIKCLSDGSIFLHQKAYAERLLQRFGMENSKPVNTPILKSNDDHQDNEDVTHFPYRQAVGSLAYLMTGTRPDIAYAISIVSRNLERPSKEDILNVKRIFRYIKGTKDEGITFSPDKDILECYSDADHGGDMTTGRSTSGTIFLYAGGAISWQSKRQSTVAISTMEAEIIAASEAAREIIWLKRILKDITDVDGSKACLCVDNESAVKSAKSPFEYHQRTKHIRLRSFFIRECIQDGIINICHIPAATQIANMLTKPLYGPRLIKLKAMAGILKKGGC